MNRYSSAQGRRARVRLSVLLFGQTCDSHYLQQVCVLPLFTPARGVASSAPCVWDVPRLCPPWQLFFSTSTAGLQEQECRAQTMFAFLINITFHASLHCTCSTDFISSFVVEQLLVVEKQLVFCLGGLGLALQFRCHEVQEWLLDLCSKYKGISSGSKSGDFAA